MKMGLSWQQVYDLVACPKCKAWKTEPCNDTRTTTFRVFLHKPHQVRIDAAYRIEKELQQ